MRLKHLILSTLILLFGISTLNAQTVTVDAFVENTLYPATVLLFSQNDDGGMRMRCTATAFEKTEEGYRFVTAAHCATEDGESKDKAHAIKVPFYVSDDVEGSKDYIPTKIVFCGKRSRGDDFCVFESKTKHAFPVIAIGVDPKNLAGEPVIDIAAPLGLGKLVLYGRITKAHLDRDIVEDDINWSGAELLQLPGTDGGASGSAIICTAQRAICGFLVGTLDKTQIIALPVSHFSKFYEESKAGKYKWWDKEE